jgi:hypothetical protein
MSDAVNIETNEDLRGEYEIALESWLRRRFTFFCASFFALECVIAALTIALAIVDPELPDTVLGDQTSSLLRIVAYMTAPLVSVLILGWFLWVVRPRLERRSELVRAASILILLLGLVDLALLVLIRDDPSGTEGAIAWSRRSSFPGRRGNR